MAACWQENMWRFQKKMRTIFDLGVIDKVTLLALFRASRSISMLQIDRSLAKKDRLPFLLASKLFDSKFIFALEKSRGFRRSTASRHAENRCSTLKGFPQPAVPVHTPQGSSNGLPPTWLITTLLPQITDFAAEYHPVLGPALLRA